MKKLIFSFKVLSLLLFIGLIASCNKEETEFQAPVNDQMLSKDVDLTMEDVVYSFAEMDQDEETEASPEAFPQGKRPHCFDIVFPISVTLPDSTVLTVNSKDELKDAMKTWRENNRGIPGRPTFNFPINVVLKNGEVKTIENKEQFKKLLRFCQNHRKHKIKRCLHAKFPLTLVFPDETTQEVNSPEEMKNAIIEWKQNNPDVEGKITIQFPFKVVLPNGKTVTINNKEDLMKLLRKCNKFRKHRRKKRG